MSSLDYNTYSNNKCKIESCSSRTGISYPFCTKCLDSSHRLSVKLSNIEEIGLILQQETLESDIILNKPMDLKSDMDYEMICSSNNEGDLLRTHYII